MVFFQAGLSLLPLPLRIRVQWETIFLSRGNRGCKTLSFPLSV